MTLKINGILLNPLMGTLPADHKKNDMTKRPYISITHTDHAKIAAVSTAKLSDFFLYKDEVVSFGCGDGGYVLMPLTKDRAETILSLNGLS